MMPVPAVAASFSATAVTQPEHNGAVVPSCLDKGTVKSCLDGDTVKSCLSSSSSCLARSASLHNQHVERVTVMAGSKSRDHLNATDSSPTLPAGTRGPHISFVCSNYI